MGVVNDQVEPIVRNVGLVGLRMTAGNFLTTLRPVDLDNPILALDQQLATVAGDADGGFVVEVEFYAKIRNEADSPDVVRAEVVASFEISYSLADGFAVDEDALEIFAQTNGVFNAWSYWREFFQSCMTRMGLPAFQLPMLRSFPAQVETDDSAAVDPNRIDSNVRDSTRKQ